jgi:ectoine hydroxylase-related dioxygenase (phytanoyl-CoA dioxygenase family)
MKQEMRESALVEQNPVNSWCLLYPKKFSIYKTITFGRHHIQGHKTQTIWEFSKDQEFAVYDHFFHQDARCIYY